MGEFPQPYIVVHKNAAVAPNACKRYF